MQHVYTGKHCNAVTENLISCLQAMMRASSGQLCAAFFESLCGYCADLVMPGIKREFSASRYTGGDYNPRRWGKTEIRLTRFTVSCVAPRNYIMSADDNSA